MYAFVYSHISICLLLRSCGSTDAWLLAQVAGSGKSKAKEKPKLYEKDSKRGKTQQRQPGRAVAGTKKSRKSV
jgi:hypothetical protein